jgi:hypothetical protein
MSGQAISAPRRISRAKLNEQNARRYPAPSGDASEALLNASAICVEFGRNFWTLQKYDKHHLTPHLQYFARPGQKPGLPEQTWLRSDVSAYLKTLERPEDDHGRYVMPGGSVRFNYERVCKELGRPHHPMARQTLAKLVEAGVITFEWWISPVTRRREQWCTQSALDEAKKKVRECKPEEREGPEGRQILLSAALKILQPKWLKRYRKRRKLRTQRITRWAEIGCSLLGGRQIKIYRQVGLPNWMLKSDFELLCRALDLPRGQYLIDGVVCIGRTAAKEARLSQGRFKAAQERECRKLSHRGCNGKPRRVVPLASLDSLPPIDSPFNGVYHDGRVSLSKEAKRSGLSRNFLKKCIISTSYLPEGKLPSVKQTPIHKRYHAWPEHTVLPDDVDRLKAAIRQATEISAPCGWKDATDICDELEASSLGAVLFIGTQLKEGREASLISAWRPQKPIAVRGGGKRRPWFYEPREALDYIRGNRIEREVAKGNGPGPLASLGSSQSCARERGPRQPATSRRTGRPRKGESDKEHLVIDALAVHHKMEGRVVENLTPAKVKRIAKLASGEHVKVSVATVSRFLSKKFPGRGYKGYEAACARGTIGTLLAVWQGDVSEHLADLRPEEYGRGEDDN